MARKCQTFLEALVEHRILRVGFGPASLHRQALVGFEPHESCRTRLDPSFSAPSVDTVPVLSLAFFRLAHLFLRRLLLQLPGLGRVILSCLGLGRLLSFRRWHSLFALIQKSLLNSVKRKTLMEVGGGAEKRRRRGDNKNEATNDRRYWPWSLGSDTRLRYLLSLSLHVHDRILQYIFI